MTDGAFSRDDSRSAPRFVPKSRLSMFLAGSQSPLVHGDVKDLSERGARVRADAVLDNGGAVTINVRNGHSFLFRAEARIVWRASEVRPHGPVDCDHGILFTELSPFTRKLIRRLSGEDLVAEDPATGDIVEAQVWDSDSDPDLQVLFRAERSAAEVDRDRLDLLADPSFDPQMVNGRAGIVEDKVVPEPSLPKPTLPELTLTDPFLELDDLDIEPVDVARFTDSESDRGAPRSDARNLERDLSGGAELSGNLGYFDNADVLQMLEAARATGVLYVDGPVNGEIQLLGGCFSKGLSTDDAAFELIVARRGRFHFIPGRILGNVHKRRTVTQVLLEAQLRRDQIDRS